MVNDEEYESAQTKWPSNKDDYELGELIGVGGTAVVYIAYCKPRKQKCAIKIVNLEKRGITKEVSEIRSMSVCKHKNLVTYFTSFVIEEELWIAMDLLLGGSIADIINYKMQMKNCINGVFDQKTIATILKQVLKGLEYLHNNGQMHRDIKAENILLGNDGTIQIADFGHCCWTMEEGYPSQRKKNYSCMGTLPMMAPEVMESKTGYDEKADIWSFGITVIQLITGEPPYVNYPSDMIVELTIKHSPPTMDSVRYINDKNNRYGKSIRGMIADCLRKDPAERPTASTLLKHPFFKKAKGRKFLARTLLKYVPSVELRADDLRDFIDVPRSCWKIHRSVIGCWEWSFDEVQNQQLVRSCLNKLQRYLGSARLTDLCKSELTGSPLRTRYV